MSTRSAWTPPFWRTLTAPKSEAAPDENEDAVAANPDQGRFAVADGATQSAFAGLWARLLVEGYAHAGHAGAAKLTADWLAVRRADWSAAVDGVDVPWFVSERREQGAFAAFLGLSLSIDDRKNGHWFAVGTGDVCVFKMRGGRLRTAWPLTHSSQFNNTPALLGSRGGDCASATGAVTGDWRSGDHLFLMTDALACWFLARLEAAENPCQWLLSLIESPRAEEQYARAVLNLRASGELKDDDTTLMAIRV
ncbi:protein phosphatase 2C domain-containing protein [Fimbriiglobus ruber]|uniref:Protein phosphatase 2C domain-containing protein n=1 Tax=Fimbriiglobus ruber TaxID=1908690 RepID=A0A225DVX6_9BACT|nr:protein phosphatase 2C domain-containing protein [Fimbriiglobus ruber]OWK40465.1 hypothetical protein FRUB_05384 [Fimbriiglobus ruber]